MAKINRTGGKTKTRLSVMSEIESFSQKDPESEVGSIVLNMEPPKMFILPNEMEIDEAIAQSIVQQVIARVPRTEMRKLSECLSRPLV